MLMYSRGVGVKRDIKNYINRRLTQFSDLVSKLLMAAIVITGCLSSYFNILTLLRGWAGIFEFFLSLLYISIWTVFLLWCIRIKSLSLLKLYLIFWGIEVLYLAMYRPVVFMQIFEPLDIDILFFVTVPVFLTPLMGFDMLFELIRGALGIDFLYGILILPFLIVSVIMFAAGLVARKIIKGDNHEQQ